MYYLQSLRANVSMTQIALVISLLALRTSVRIHVLWVTPAAEKPSVKLLDTGLSANAHQDGQEILTKNASNVRVKHDFFDNLYTN